VSTSDHAGSTDELYDVSSVTSHAALPTCDPTSRFYTVPLSNETIVDNIAHAKANVTQRNILATLPTYTPGIFFIGLPYFKVLTFVR